MGSQRVGHKWTTELNWSELNWRFLGKGKHRCFSEEPNFIPGVKRILSDNDSSHNRKSHNTWGNMLIWVRLITNSRFGLEKTSKWTKCSNYEREITHGHGFEWTTGVGDGQGGLACCSSWGCKESDTTEWLNWTELIVILMYVRSAEFTHFHSWNFVPPCLAATILLSTSMNLTILEFSCKSFSIFFLWLAFSLSIMTSKFIHVAANGWFSFFF